MPTPDARLAQFCKARGVDGVIIRRRANMAWATGGADFHCDTASELGIAWLEWTPARKVVHTDTIEAPRLRAEEPLSDWDFAVSDWWARDAVLPGLLSSNRYAADWPDDCLYEYRATLSLAQIDHARALGRDTSEVVGRILRQDARPGMTEHHLAGAVSGWLRDRAIHGHVILIAADDRIARFRHPIPSPRPIERCAMVAVCAQRRGLIVSVTRLVHFGPPPADLVRRHQAVCAVDLALHLATRPGVRWCDALATGIAEYARQGFPDEWKLHHQGGPMGYMARDFRATPDESRPVLPAQLVGWNPSITGTKSEDTILSTGEVITPDPLWPATGGRPDILVR